MKKRKASTALAASAVLGLAVTACSSASGGTSASGGISASGGTSASAASRASSSAKLTACPQSSGSAGAALGGQAGAAGTARPSGASTGTRPGGAISIPVAKTIKASSTATSTVIDPTGPQMRCGQTQLTNYSNIVYSTPSTSGKKTQLELDLQVPKTSGKKPLVVYITGGGWVSADKSGNLDERTYVAEQGYVVASIQYRTTPDGATYSDAVEDVKSAVRYLRAHAAQYHINASQVAVWGQSAGGYLAAMTGTTNGDTQFNAGGNLDQSSDVQAVVDEFGPSDLTKLAADFDTAAQKENYAPGNALAKWVFGPATKKSILDDPAAAAAADPITHISSATPPFVELHGSADRLVSPSQTLLLNNALKAKGIASTRYVVKGAGHGDISVTGSTTTTKDWSTQKVMDRIVSFLRQHLGN